MSLPTRKSFIETSIEFSQAATSVLSFSSSISALPEEENRPSKDANESRSRDWTLALPLKRQFAMFMLRQTTSIPSSIVLEGDDAANSNSLILL